MSLGIPVLHANPSPPKIGGLATPAVAMNRHILLVDDNQSIHNDIRKILDPQRATAAALDDLEADLFEEPEVGPAVNRTRFDLDSALQGPQALLMLQEARAAGRPYAVAFVDMRMPPGWDGIETISRLWREDPDLQVVICTAYSDHSWHDIIKRLAPTDGLLILRKPFDSVEIRQMAQALTTKWMLRQQVRARIVDLQDQVQTRTHALAETNRQLQVESAARKRMETELRLTQKLDAVGQVAAGIAHEISTPLQFLGDTATSLRAAFEGLRQLHLDLRALIDDAVGDHPGLTRLRDAAAIIERTARPDLLAQEITEGIERTVQGGDRIATIVQAMKEFLHADETEKHPADLNRALANTLVVAKHEYKYVAEVETDLGELPSVVCHIGDLNQVFLNLIVNAAHAVADVVPRTHKLGRIRVATRLEADSVIVTISDTGSGIAPEHRDRIFTPFFTTKGAARGTGQGLAIAQAIVVERHGGKIAFQSETGVGTTFTVHLPIEPSRDR